MKKYSVSCIYTQARFKGKIAIPANDNWQHYSGEVRCYSEKGIFPELLKILQNLSHYKYVKINDLQFTEL